MTGVHKSAQTEIQKIVPEAIFCFEKSRYQFRYATCN